MDVVSLGDRASRPMLVDIANRELFKVAAIARPITLLSHFFSLHARYSRLVCLFVCLYGQSICRTFLVVNRGYVPRRPGNWGHPFQGPMPATQDPLRRAIAKLTAIAPPGRCNVA